MRIGVFQFHGSCDIEKNFRKISDTIIKASESNVRLLTFHECALCGYPPVETDISLIDYAKIETFIQAVCELAKKYRMYIAVGTIRLEGSHRYNSIQLIDENGNITGCYDKRALWGWDTGNYSRGTNPGIFRIDGINVGFRICYDVRFPEYFRELFLANVPLCFVSFCDVSEQDDPERYDIIKAHLVTRAAENVISIVSVNSISDFQTAPTAIFDCNGKIVLEAPKNEESFLVYDYHIPDTTFGMKGRIENSNRILYKDF